MKLEINLISINNYLKQLVIKYVQQQLIFISTELKKDNGQGIMGNMWRRKVQLHLKQRE